MPTATMPEIAKLAKDGRERLLKHVRSEIAELEKEIGILRATERDLSGRATTTGARAGNGQRATSRKAAPRTRGANGQRATTRQATRTRARTTSPEDVFGAIIAGSHRSPMIARKLGASSSTVLRHLRTLEAQGKVKRTGSGRDITWMPATP